MLKIAENLKLPGAILEQHMAVLGKTRSGKSSVMRLFVESLLDRNERVCIIDPKGDWWGLKSSADGKSAGYPVVIFGGRKADVPLNEHAGASVAELVATGNRPCVIDLGGWMVGERTRFFVDFASTLFRSINAPLRLVIDEVHNFAPQQKIEKNPDAMKMLHWANRLGSEGAGKGLVLLSASQRPQKVHKDFLTCAETLIAMRVIHVLDRNAVKQWIDGAGDSAKGQEVLSTLASMTRGEGWVWSPEAGFGPQRVKFAMFKTYDSFAAPTGQAAKPLKGWAEVDLEEVKNKLAAVVEQAKADDPKELRKKIVDLQRKITDLERQQSKPQAPTSDQAAIDRALAEHEARWLGLIDVRDRAWVQMQDTVDTAMSLLRTVQDMQIDVSAVPSKPAPRLVRPPQPQPAKPVARNSAPAKTGSDHTRIHTGDLPAINKTQQRILDALAWYESVGISQPSSLQVGAIALIDTTGGHFSNTVGPLSSGGLVERGDGTMRLTAAGRALAKVPDRLGTLADYHNMLRDGVRRARSASGKTVEILDAVIAAGGAELTSDEIGEAVGIDHTGGHFSNTIGPLGTLGLIERRSGKVKPTSLLFPKNVF